MFPVAREGRLIILLAAAVAAAVGFYIDILVSLPLWGLWLAGLFFLRNLPRETPALPLANVSPVDGVVLSVEQVQDPYLKREALRIRIKQHALGEFNVHCPIEGKIKQRWWPESRREDPQIPAKQFAVWIQTDEGDDTVFAVDVSRPLHYLHCSIQSGERTGQGRRCGLIGFGLPVDVYFPLSTRAEVEPGQRVRGATDIIATFIHG